MGTAVVIPAEAGIQTLLFVHEENLDSRFHGNDMGEVILLLIIKFYKIMLTMQRSPLSFAAILIFGVIAVIFIVRKGNEAADELERLNSGAFGVHRVALVEKLNDGASDTSNWKTYRNEKYGFEFHYPNDVIVDFDKETDTLRVYDPTYDTTNKVGAEVRSEYREIEFKIQPFFSKILEKEISKLDTELKNTPEHLREFVGQNKLFLSGGDGFIYMRWSGLVGNYHQAIFYNKYYLFASSPAYNDFLREVLSTFKFIK